MPHIPSPNPNIQRVEPGGSETGYVHPAQRRGGPIPLAFQVTSPLNRMRVMMPHALVMHVNPSSISETYTQKVERFQTRGGWVEQHWGHELTDVSVDQSTGAFMNIYSGLTSVLRQRTIAWDRYRDLHDLYKNNGSVHDPRGNIVLQGYILMMYDRGSYLGTFRSFEVSETDESPFAFKLSWSFKIEHTILSVADTPGPRVRPAFFQSQNIPATTSGGGLKSVPQAQQTVTNETPTATVASDGEGGPGGEVAPANVVNLPPVNIGPPIPAGGEVLELGEVEISGRTQ